MSSFNTNSADDNGATGGAAAPQGGFQPAPGSDQQPNAGQQVDLAKIQKRLDDSQKFIEQLKLERQQDRQLIEQLQSKSGPSLDEIKDLISKAGSDGVTPVNPDELVNTVYERVNQNLTQKQVQEQEKQNFDAVARVLQTKYGKEVDVKVAELASEIGYSLEDVINLSKKNPKAVFKLLGITEKPQQPAAHSYKGGTNTLGMPPAPPVKKPSIMSARNEKERIDVFSSRLSKHTNQQN